MSPAKAGSRQQWQLKPADVVVLDLQGNLVAGADQRTREWQIHLGIYNAFERAGGIIHAQAGHFMAFVAAGKLMPPYSTLESWNAFLGCSLKRVDTFRWKHIMRVHG